MTDTNTPPAASERMTAGRLAQIRELRDTCLLEPHEGGMIGEAITDLLALVDKQSEALAKAQGRFDYLVARNGEDALKRFDHLATLHDRIRTLSARAEAAERELARWEFNSRANMQYAAQNLTDRILKLQAFKDYVHQRLDEAGIPKEPNGEHSKAGCRVGDRLDIALTLSARAEAAEARAETARAEAEESRERLDIATARLNVRADFMRREGYRPCDIAACNCGSWHGGHAAQRLREISAIVPHNGVLLKDAIAALVELSDNGLRELLEAMLEYFEDRSDISGPNERVPNQEMRFAEEIKAALKELKR